MKCTIQLRTGKNADLASSLAQIVNGKTDALPEGETAPQGAEILVILGGSYK